MDFLHGSLQGAFLLWSAGKNNLLSPTISYRSFLIPGHFNLTYKHGIALILIESASVANAIILHLCRITQNAPE